MLRWVVLVALLMAACKDKSVPPPAPSATVAAPAVPVAAPEDASPTGPRAFFAWAGQARATPTAYGRKEECYDAQSSQFGTCERQHHPDNFTTWTIAYPKRNPKAFRIHAHFGGPILSGGSIGASATPSRAWRYASLVKSLCKFESGELAGMYAQLEVPGPRSAFGPSTNVWLFEPAFLDASPSFRNIVMTQGL